MEKIILIFILVILVLAVFLLNFWSQQNRLSIKISNLEDWKKDSYFGGTIFYHPMDKETYFGYNIHKATKEDFQRNSLKMGLEVSSGECDEIRDIIVDREFLVQNYLAKEYILECKSKDNYFIIRYVAVFNNNRYVYFSFTTPKASYEEMNKKFNEILDNFIWE